MGAEKEFPNNVTLTIDGIRVTVPQGTLIVNAAKKAGIDIPVFCYHPKMEPVGMCRMCLVEIGRPVIDRTTGQTALEADGSPKVQFGPKLETACTTPVTEGMVVLNASEKAKAGREDIIEFLLTSHPLDCPICDKGGECPLQNLTMGFGPGESRYLYDEKKHLAKHVPLGGLIFLDRERCIQCGRCVRFQDEVVDEPVIGFSQRGRSLEIVTFSEPGFDSYFSGNTTDICPVGALTTADFRFGARPWELKLAASICTQCPVGCNITFNVRREAVSNGKVVVKRVMPRQNEQVNEIWICDKGRFNYQYTEYANLLNQPLVRKNGDLTPAAWDEALDLVAGELCEAGNQLLTLASGRLSNEDLFNLSELTRSQGGQAVLYSTMAGGNLVAQVGLGKGTNFATMGSDTAILVVACDLEEEAPIWWLRLKQAADRGARLIVVNPRQTRLDSYATQVIRYPYGSEAAVILAMVNSLSAKRPDIPESPGTQKADILEAAQTFAGAKNAVILFGSEGTGLKASEALAQACANLLITSGHTGRENNGLLGVWQRANDQGAWDLGFRPVEDLRSAFQSSKLLYLAAVDPFRDDPSLKNILNNPQSKPFIVVQELALTETAQLADVVFPVQAYTEREGSLTSGERRVQRYFAAVPEAVGSLPDFGVVAQIAQRLNIGLEGKVAARVMNQIAASIPDYAGLHYLQLSQVEEQWPIVGRSDLYYGGTTYENRQGLGVQIAPSSQRGAQPALGWVQPPVLNYPENGLLAVPVTRLYDRGSTLQFSSTLQPRLPEPSIILNPDDARLWGISEGDVLAVTAGENTSRLAARVEAGTPQGVALVPRSLGLYLNNPLPIQIKVVETARKYPSAKTELIAADQV
jgi:NADH-quinone oxidoreductase subunit G